jgi:hypothetical protein
LPEIDLLIDWILSRNLILDVIILLTVSENCAQKMFLTPATGVMLETITYLATALLAVGIPAWYVYKNVNRTRSVKKKFTAAVERGLTEPDTLHPKIDPNLCIGSSACVQTPASVFERGVSTTFSRLPAH